MENCQGHPSVGEQEGRQGSESTCSCQVWLSKRGRGLQLIEGIREVAGSKPLGRVVMFVSWGLGTGVREFDRKGASDRELEQRMAPER